MEKLNARKLLFLPKDKYHDGDGLYISISSPGKGKWSFRYTINKKAREMGLGIFPDVSLLEARQYALSNKQLLRKKIDPIDEKNRAEVLRQQQNKKFSEVADLYIETKKKHEWTNPKSYQSWKKAPCSRTTKAGGVGAEEGDGGNGEGGKVGTGGPAPTGAAE